jgi:hypothetical protein
MFTENEVKAAPVVLMLFWTCTTTAGPEPIAVTPVPVRLAVCGLPLALSATAKVPVRVDVVEGLNVTLIEQFAPGASVVPQLFVWAKSPVVVIPEIASGAVPVFENVAFWAALVVPTT